MYPIKNSLSRFLMKYLHIILVLLFFNIPSYAQLDEELGFVYVKAEYLMGTERYDDAIKELNKVINENPSYKDALLLRAKAKYILGAHLGVRNDVIEFIEANGINAEAARLLGLADYALGKYKSALNSLNLALNVLPNDIDMLNSRAAINYEEGRNLAACEDWEKAAKLGSGTAAKSARSNCGYAEDVVTEDKPKQNKTSFPKDSSGSSRDRIPGTIPDRPSKESSTTKPDTDDEDMSKDEGNDELEVQQEDEDTIDLDSKNEIYVDEDLSLILKDGLGARKVLEQPNILILSDESGTVSVDVCVNGGGRVTNATFNSPNSNLSTPSIISLAVRKSKEFWFEDSKEDQICGVIEFHVTGRE